MFYKVGHRGAKAYETENTLESFQKAIALGVNAIEFDVHQSKDGEVVVIHDDNLKKVFGKDIQVKEATVRELKQATESRIPTLGEALRFINGKVEKILVEIKEPGCEKNTLDAVRKERMEDRAVLISFHGEVIARVRKLDKTIETGLVYAKPEKPVDTALNLHAQYLIAFYRFVHTKDVEKAHKNSLRVIAWTINTKEEAKTYIAKGVDGIASDKPDILKDLF